MCCSCISIYLECLVFVLLDLHQPFNAVVLSKSRNAVLNFPLVAHVQVTIIDVVCHDHCLTTKSFLGRLWALNNDVKENGCWETKEVKAQAYEAWVHTHST